jgi:hypothetical protein
VDSGTAVVVTITPDQQAVLDKIRMEALATDTMTADEFGTRYAVPLQTSLGYDPAQSLNLPKIQASALGMSATENALFMKNGFVISAAHKFPTFTYGYQAIYSEHLPLFVSADSILNAVHRSYDSILKFLEQSVLMSELDTMLSGMRDKLAAGGASQASADVQKDADFYLAVALELLRNATVAPVAGADPSTIDAFTQKAVAASGADNIVFFGVPRDIDFSQFTPRGHYTDTLELTRYFRAMMWLGRMDFRLIETLPDHSQVFRRRQLEAAVQLRTLMDPSASQHWDRIDATIGAFVGEHDSMTPPQIDALMHDLGASTITDLGKVTDTNIAQAIVAGGYGVQKISSDIMTNGLGSGTMPLSSSFLIFGQRYVVDSHVFSNLVYDRVRHGSVMRMMPNPLDVGFAALGNDLAGALLSPEIKKWGYAPDLHFMRFLVDEEAPAFWEENIYNLWLSALRALSPSKEIARPASAGLPVLAATEPWGRRILNTQLASWAELRHDTILYAKQSYTAGPTCEFPDAYVEPYPEFFDRIAKLATMGQTLVAKLAMASGAVGAIGPYFDGLQATAQRLLGIAQSERAGTPLTPDQMAFINQAVTVQEVCGGGVADGWYPKIVFGNSLEFDPTIADVHTQPADEAGNPVGKVLHVGTGYARTMILSIATCTGPHAYVGLASSYFEKTTDNFKRLTDPEWASQLNASPEAPWMADLVAQ